MPGPPLGPLRARFAELVHKAPSGHWLWQGPIERRGYGTLGLAGRRYYAHRLSLLRRAKIMARSEREWLAKFGGAL